ncbi:right-handed parallel beta-helix repeat-containing protein [Pseudonocardia sp. CA-107938]|uniref:right-handed parallel beta-helix repeat-containing protein n=1 Tax=Pseudonocardia sp. CA-107938 TaxID=3240021 RepID=UPI003D9008A8
MRRRDRRLALAGAVLLGAALAGCSDTAGVPLPAFSVPGTEAEVGPLAGDAAQEQQARLVAVEDDRIYAVSTLRDGGSPAYVAPATAPSLVPTAVLTARPLPYGLADLAGLDAARQRPDGSWDLLMSVVVERGATLRVQAPGAVLRLASGRGGFASIVAAKGTVELAGALDRPLTIASWDPDTGNPDGTVTDGRAYLRSAGGRLDLADVAASDLGFWSGRTGGVAWTGSRTELGTGAALRTVVQRSRYGMFVARTTGLTIDSGAVRDNELDGLLVHRSSADVTVHRLEASGNGRNGVTVSAGASRVVLSELSAHANAGAGIRVDGAPRPDPAAPPGTVPEPGRTFTVERSVLDGNREVGIVADTAAELTVADNSVAGSPDGILVRGAGTRQELRGNTVEATGFGIAVRDGATDTRLVGNTVRTATIAMQVADARADLQGNAVGAARRYAVSLVGASGGTTVAANRLGGHGPSAIDTARVADGSSVAVGANDDTGWVVQRDESGRFLGYLGDHPLLLLWSLILVLPVAAALWTRHRRRVPATVAAVPEDRPAEPPVVDTERTQALPITRVTIVSQVDA